MTLPSHAAAAAQDGDTVLIDAGSYVDATNWRANDLVIRGVGGRAHVRDKTWGGKAIWVIQGNNATVEYIEFSGARVPDKNGAGIRQEGTHLTLRHCYIHHNEMGILTSNDANSHILFEYCEFAQNGYGDGYSHNMYINHVGRFTMRFCYSHDAVIGHNVKSRAHETWLLYNRFDEALGGNTSREIDIPNGGLAVIVGNILDHGSNTDNSNLLGFGHEGYTNPRRALFVANNTFVTARGAGGFVTLPSAPADTVLVYNNIFAGRSTALSGASVFVDTASNIVAREITDAGFRNTSARDFMLLPTSPAIDAATDAGSVDRISLTPAQQYAHPSSGNARVQHGKLDCGAYEYLPPVDVHPELPALTTALRIVALTPQPAQDEVTVTVTGCAGDLQLRMVDMSGKVRLTRTQFSGYGSSARFPLEVGSLPRGLYILTVDDGRKRASHPLHVR
jgi:hypothetical protein